MKTSARWLLGAGLALSVSGPLSAQLPQPAKPVPGAGVPAATSAAAASKRTMAPEFGVQGVTYRQFAAMAFTPLDSAEGFSYPYPPYSGQVLRTVSSGTIIPFAVNLDLPEGAQVTYLELDGCDQTGGSGFVQGSLVQSDYLGNVSYYAPFLASDGSGCRDWNEDLTSANLIIHNFVNHYWLLGYVASGGAFATGLAGMIVGYHLQVPTADFQDFTDVPTSSPQYQFIEALYHAGVTAGCGGGNYCPDNPVTRGQMAVFLAKALGLYN